MILVNTITILNKPIYMMTSQRQSTGTGSMIVPPVRITGKDKKKKSVKVSDAKKDTVNKLMFGGVISQQNGGKHKLDANTGATISKDTHKSPKGGGANPSTSKYRRHPVRKKKKMTLPKDHKFHEYYEGFKEDGKVDYMFKDAKARIKSKSK